MKTIFHDLVELLAHQQSFVLATVVSRSGSAPRAVGARMAALPDGTIRGTVGGGLVMNAGTREGEIREILVAARLMDRLGNVRDAPRDTLVLSYRRLELEPETIILGATLLSSRPRRR